MRRWANKYESCIKCNKTEHPHVSFGVCKLCKSVRKGKRATGSQWNERDERVRNRTAKLRGNLKMWEELSKTWIGQTQKEYDGQEYRCSGCEKECMVKSPFKDVIKDSFQFGQFRNLGTKHDYQ